MLSTGLLAFVLLLRQAPHTLTLDQAVNLASDVSKQTRIADATVEQAKGTLKVARSGLFPQLTSSLSYQRTLATEFSGIFTQNNEIPVGNLDLPFGRSNSWQGR